MNEKELKNLIGKGESQELEFKQKPSEDIGKTICSFANTNDGIILVGISDKKEIIGCNKKHEQQIANIAHTCKPSVYPKIEEVKADDKTVFVIKIKKSGNIHSYKNIAYNRIGSHDKPLSPEEVIELAKKTGKIRFDEKICEYATLKDIDWGFVKRFVKEYEELNKTKIKSDEKNLLKSMGCIVGDKPTNAGILLFGKNPQKFFINAFVAVAKYKGGEVGTERLDYKEFKGKLFDQITSADAYLKDNTKIMSRLVEGKLQREDIPEYDFFSIRELIVNAIAHRDYAEEGSKIIIKIFDDRTEYHSPGGLPEGVTPRNIVEKQKSRNPIIVKALNRLHYIEELGEGWDRIIFDYKRHPLRPKLPEIKDLKNAVLVKLYKAEINLFERYKDELNERQIKLLKYLQKNETVTSADYVKMFDITERQARLDLSKLALLNLVKREGKARNTKYKLYPEISGNIRK